MCRLRPLNLLLWIRTREHMLISQPTPSNLSVRLSPLRQVTLAIAGEKCPCSITALRQRNAGLRGGEVGPALAKNPIPTTLRDKEIEKILGTLTVNASSQAT
jgi:hypothetical protein